MPLLSTIGKEDGGGRRRSKMGRKETVPEEGYGRAAEGYRKRNRVMSWHKGRFSVAVELSSGSLTLTETQSRWEG